MKLSESFDRPLPFKRDNKDTYSFESNGETYTVELDRFNNFLRVDFYNGDYNEKTTGTQGKSATAVFATVGEVLQRYLKKHKEISVIQFEGSNQRYGLYKKIADAMAKKLGWQVKEAPYDTVTVFRVMNESAITFNIKDIPDEKKEVSGYQYFRDRLKNYLSSKKRNSNEKVYDKASKEFVDLVKRKQNKTKEYLAARIAQTYDIDSRQFYQYLKNRQLAEEVIEEGRDAPLYHATKVEKLISIAQTNTIKDTTIHPRKKLAMGRVKDDIAMLKGVSLTRSIHFARFWAPIVFELDQRALSYNYKFAPTNFFQRIFTKGTPDSKRAAEPNEFEEFVIGPIKNLDRYVKSVFIDFKSSKFSIGVWRGDDLAMYMLLKILVGLGKKYSILSNISNIQDINRFFNRVEQDWRRLKFDELNNLKLRAIGLVNTIANYIDVTENEARQTLDVLKSITINEEAPTTNIGSGNIAGVTDVHRKLLHKIIKKKRKHDEIPSIYPDKSKKGSTR